ncbi:tungsten formylmethanofuran dehydrogenase subunit E [Deltaproteobacteria bacterium]|nr:tungsten formylmethanofuran dehydrogenase subunit E [Deltaproteobacteria bacterium]
MAVLEVPSYPDIPAPTKEERVVAYEIAGRSRATEEHIVRLVSRGEVKFAIWGPGEEVHGTATALALHKVCDRKKFGIVPHYRSGALCAMWARLGGYSAFTLDVLRQQFSKDTDRMSRGRQMVYHLDMPELGILPVQSPVGMQLGKAAGYAMGFKMKGVEGSLSMAIIGDGTSAEGDLHDAMNACSVWQLPTLFLITDNRVAISTTPDEGRGIKDFGTYAESFGVHFISADGRSFDDVYEKTYRAARFIVESGKPVMMHVHDLPRFNGHSSAADVTYDLKQDDPLIRFGDELVAAGAATERDVLRRVKGEGRDFFAHHELGNLMARQDEEVRAILDQVRGEADPPPESVFENIRAPFPDCEEPTPGPGQTNITYAGAIRAALKNIVTHHNGVMWGQDIGRLGGVMTATQGLKKLFPNNIIDAPLNEPLILGTGCGAGLHKDLVALPEIQFGDYTLNAFHWLVHMGNLYWCTNGKSNFATILRTPVDPFGGGAVYHSMSLDGYFTPIPGLTIVMPSTSFDVYGLLMSAAKYRGPVVCLEPKWMYRQSLGPAFPGEPTDADAVAALKKSIMRGEVPDLPADLAVPLGKGIVRRPGSDATVVAWGRAVWTCMNAAEKLAKEGIELEVIDLRTLVPPDMELVYASVERTGRLLVAAEDRTFSGFVRQIQGDVIERFPGLPTKALGQKYVPGIAQNLALEEAVILTAEDVLHAGRAIVGAEVSVSRTKIVELAPRYFLV